LIEPVETADHVHAGLVVLCRERAISMAGSYVYVSEVTTVEASRCTRKQEEKIQAQTSTKTTMDARAVACSSLRLILSPHPIFCIRHFQLAAPRASGGRRILPAWRSWRWRACDLRLHVRSLARDSLATAQHVAEWSSYHSVRPQRLRRRRGEEAIE
jgi:hypothetical protein